jgi:hypothetical protein
MTLYWTKTFKNNKAVEIQIADGKQVSFGLGASFSLSCNHVFLSTRPIIFSLELHVRWTGDHPGVYLNCDFLGRYDFDFEWYDMRHEEDIKKGV